ncbi:hypothetical protein ACPPVU_18850 [Mucilaginibacter sp. McL0603]|uniref:hypothetical protein n=1 Tax=Mucilaginibacter sp. McL0603 TaxID=3415670 RepID=UPI003CE68F05
MKINLITLITLLVTFLTAGAQNNDRVITINNDTIPCKIIGRTTFSTYKYTTSENGKAEKITKDKFREFYTGDKSIWYRKIFLGDDEVVFMKVLERGKISLYETFVAINNMTTHISTTNLKWYATKNSDTAVFIQTDASAIFTGNKKGRKAFAGYIADKKDVYDQYIAIKDPSIEDMVLLALVYNTGERLKQPAPEPPVKKADDSADFNPSQN